MPVLGRRHACNEFLAKNPLVHNELRRFVAHTDTHPLHATNAPGRVSFHLPLALIAIDHLQQHALEIEVALGREGPNVNTSEFELAGDEHGVSAEGADE